MERGILLELKSPVRLMTMARDCDYAAIERHRTRVEVEALW